jgi:hypothetical protein
MRDETDSSWVATVAEGETLEDAFARVEWDAIAKEQSRSQLEEEQGRQAKAA